MTDFFNNFESFWEQSKKDIEAKLPTRELFFVSNKGRVRPKWDEPATYGRLSRGYMRFGSKYGIAADRAVCAIFNGFPDPKSDKLTVDHLDGNALNNCAENLEFVSMKEQLKRSWKLNLNRKTSSAVTGKPVEACKIDFEKEIWIRYPTEEAAALACETTQGNVSNACSKRFKSTNGFKFRFADTGVLPLLPGEEWRTAVLKSGTKCGWMVSNFGRVKSPTKKISYGSKMIDEYMKVSILKHSIFVHNLVAYTFIGPPPPNMPNATIDHIDRNRQNNNVTNLRWATKTQQLENRVIKRKEKAQVVIYGRKKGEIRFTKYDTLQEAADTLYINRRHIIACCRGEMDFINNYEFKTDALEYSNLPGEIWKQFFIEHFNTLRELPLPTRDHENDKKCLADYRAKRKIQHAIVKEKNAAKKRKLPE